MKFLIDRCAGQRLADWLREQGHDWALAEERILVTMDKDFGQIVYVQNAPHCGLVRLPDVPWARRIALMRTLLETHAKDLADGAILTVRGDRIRVSRFP